MAILKLDSKQERLRPAPPGLTGTYGSIVSEEVGLTINRSHVLHRPAIGCSERDPYSWDFHERPLAISVLGVQIQHATLSAPHYMQVGVGTKAKSNHHANCHQFLSVHLAQRFFPVE